MTVRKKTLAFGHLAFLAAMWSGVWLMVSASLSYADLGRAHPFMLEKLPLAHPTIYWVALAVHVPTALFSLPACLLLLLASLRRRLPRLHRWLGRVTAALVLFAVVPSGFYLAWFAQGGVVTMLGFWLSGLIAVYAMAKSVLSARRGDLHAHRRFSAHVLAQLSVAVTSRFALLGAEALGFYDEAVYTAALLVPVGLGVLVTELSTRHRAAKIVKGKSHETFALGAGVDAVR